MRDDLLHAKACVHWAESQFESLGKRIDAWLAGNFDIVIKEQPPPATHDVITVQRKEPLPLAFNVEVGAYINVLRSSLDILATALLGRTDTSRRVSPSLEAHFPIYRSLYGFIDPKCGLESIKWLTKRERDIIKSLQPYQGGNQALWALHQLDIMRKHRRLLAAMTNPGMFSITGLGLREHYTPVATGWMTVNDQETVVGVLAKGAPHYEMKFAGYITINETALIDPKPLIPSLRDFASLANSIINLFDY